MLLWNISCAVTVLCVWFSTNFYADVLVTGEYFANETKRIVSVLARQGLTVSLRCWAVGEMVGVCDWIPLWVTQSTAVTAMSRGEGRGQTRGGRDVFYEAERKGVEKRGEERRGEDAIFIKIFPSSSHLLHPPIHLKHHYVFSGCFLLWFHSLFLSLTKGGSTRGHGFFFSP